MTNSQLSHREKKILARLEKNGSASIQELADILSVSVMTVHRDLNHLASIGHVDKRHGNALLADSANIKVDSPCAMCGKTTVGGKAFIVHLADGKQLRTCCAHCGLMAQATNRNALHAMATDFLHNQMVSANLAIYLIGGEINICCVPSVLTFGSRQEAERFQTGFGGKLVDMKEATQILSEAMHNGSKD